MQKHTTRIFVYAMSILLFIVSFLYPISDNVFASSKNEYYNETYRPQFHFSPKQNWINDPNGLVYVNGEYHLFYQYNPFGNTWGNISWGHAVSKDLVHWKHLPVALKPDDLGMIFSGSAVVDKNNTSGFFKGKKDGLVAIYTSSGETQQQSIAYSTDQGRTWTKYAGNPVIKNPGIKDFRDPKVFWHDETNKWVMVVAAGNKAMFYSSKNLKGWAYMSEFGAEEGAQLGVWEMPDLFELPIHNDPKKTKWFLKVNTNPGGTKEGYRSQYFIGEFDGTTFKNDNPPDTVLWTDYGKDFFAAQSWSNVPDRRIWIAWMNNWQYAEKIPTNPWRGSMTIPREVTLIEIPNKGVRLIQKPVEELKQLRKEKYMLKNQLVIPKTNLLSKIKDDTFEIVAKVELDSAKEFGFKVRKGEKEETIIGYDAVENKLFVDRTSSGETDFSEQFPEKFEAPLSPKDGKIKMHIFVDRSSVEVFGNDGKAVITSRIFPSPKSQGIEVYSIDGNVKLNSLEVYDLKSVWKNNE
ncbi:glycoside hydrolase family 32 protein [Bacillus taeanensis]|uniref:Glycoside hydrolase family 32 protein n=1 Tax=Bacillus taeanensis TaxID=273032 RepID=A0A366XQP2_9BACI|nr:glycoside hydrolase family 32 protein [Bacillus taeanensis]RBW67435.1 glycoside hydrolase family 32 protein [Bacillus taeanensis]